MKKEIMKRAWEIKKENKMNIFSLCLQMAWEEYKNPKANEIDDNEYYELGTSEMGQTALAVKIWDWATSKCVWIPKSQMLRHTGGIHVKGWLIKKNNLAHMI